MPVYKDEKTGTWYSKFRYKDWTGTTKNKMKRGFATRREAVAWEESFKSRVAGTLDMLFKDFVKIYKEERFPRLKEVTRQSKEFIIEDKILPYFGELPVNEITSKDIIKWQNELLEYRNSDGKPYSKSYLKTLHIQISAIMNYAVKHYNLPANPASQAGNIGNESEIKMNFWTLEEYLRFSETMMYEPVYYYYFQVLYWTGVREGEALALLQSDFDFDKKIVSITKTFQIVDGKQLITTPKTAKSVRDVVIPDFLCEELKDYFTCIPDEMKEERIFYGIDKSNLYRHIKKGAKKAGLKKIRVHDLRHSHVSLLINLGYSAVAIADRMGHESIHVTYRYAHLFPNTQQAMADQLNKLYTKKKKEI